MIISFVKYRFLLTSRMSKAKSRLTIAIELTIIIKAIIKSAVWILKINYACLNHRSLRRTRLPAKSWLNYIFEISRYRLLWSSACCRAVAASSNSQLASSLLSTTDTDQWQVSCRGTNDTCSGTSTIVATIRSITCTPTTAHKPTELLPGYVSFNSLIEPLRRCMKLYRVGP